MLKVMIVSSSLTYMLYKKKNLGSFKAIINKPF